MKQINKKISLVFFLLTVCFMLTACNEKETAVVKEEQQTTAPVETETKEEQNEPNTSSSEDKNKDEEKEEKNEEETNTDSNEEADKAEKTITIYSINDESLESEQTTANITGEVTPKAVVDAVVSAFAEHSLEIGVDSVEQEGSNVIVSFLYEKAPLSQVGTDVEETILNSIADSLIDNVPDCKGVIFRAEGEAYESGHYLFEKDELYVRE